MASRWSISTTRASAQKPQCRARPHDEAYKTEYANVHRGLHYLANAATEAYEGARDKVQRFLNAGRPEEIIFTRNRHRCAQPRRGIAGAAMTIGRAMRSCSRSWSTIPTSCRGTSMRERQGAVIKWAPVATTASSDLDAFEELLTPRTKIVAITQMSNVAGHADAGRRRS